MSPRPSAALFAVVFAVLQNASPAAAADPAQGERLARRWCADCHVATPDQARARADAPPFATVIATRRADEIAAFLATSHGSMPDMALSRAEIADIIAWMQKLAPPLEPPKAKPQKDDYKPPSRG
ncbi:MAG TPA: cytochrome c [Beijerinckiaceae bacterium]|jgi:mono/diheme cytochrome c family protein